MKKTSRINFCSSKIQHLTWLWICYRFFHKGKNNAQIDSEFFQKKKFEIIFSACLSDVLYETNSNMGIPEKKMKNKNYFVSPFGILFFCFFLFEKKNLNWSKMMMTMAESNIPWEMIYLVGRSFGKKWPSEIKSSINYWNDIPPLLLLLSISSSNKNKTWIK